MLTEHRAGTYLYNDVMTVASGTATWDNCAMRVRATVVSRPTDTRAVIDCGHQGAHLGPVHRHRLRPCDGVSRTR